MLLPADDLALLLDDEIVSQKLIPLESLVDVCWFEDLGDYPISIF
jgi:hypothetical protein